MSNYSSNITKLATRTFKTPKIAVYTYQTKSGLASFFEDAPLTEVCFYIFGEEGSLRELISNETAYDICMVNSHENVISFTRENTIFLTDVDEHTSNFCQVVKDLELDESTYNLHYTTLEKGIIEDMETESWNSFYDPDDIIYNKRKITADSSNNIKNKVILEFECAEGKFDFAYDKSLSVIGAQTGNLKSTLLQNIIRGYVNEDNTLGLNYLDEDNQDGVVLLFDTETGEDYLRQKWGFYAKEDKTIEYFSLKTVCDTKMCSEFLSIIKSVLKKGKTIRALFLDSLMDFISDFNNIHDAKKLIDQVLKVTEDLGVSVFITYQENTERNYGAVSKLSGHLGSQLQQKAEAHYRISIKGDIADLVCIKNRYCKKFNVQFNIEEVDDFVVLTSTGLKPEKEKKSEAKLKRLTEGLDAVFNSNALLTSEEIDNWIKATLDVENRSAKIWKSKLEQAGEIKSIDRGKFKDWERT